MRVVSTNELPLGLEEQIHRVLASRFERWGNRLGPTITHVAYLPTTRRGGGVGAVALLEKRDGETYVSMLAARDDGKQAGRQLLRHLIADTEVMITLHTRTDNRSARKFFKEHGFVFTKLDPHHKLGVYLPSSK